MRLYFGAAFAVLIVTLAACARVDPPPLPAVEQSSGATIMTVNIDLFDTSFVPSLASIPAGQRVRLLVRNRGMAEHHYHIVGLEPVDMLWSAPAELLAKQRFDGDDHGDHHHDRATVPYHICTSTTGLCPTGRAVHAHAGPGDVDVVVFTATSPGTYQVVCPLHPHIKGTVVVF